MTITTINPTSGETIEHYSVMDDSTVDSIIEQAYLSQKSWYPLSFSERANYLRSVAETLEKEKSDLANLMTQEMGKVRKEAYAEIEKCQWVCSYYAENAESFLTPENIETDYQESFVDYAPLGTIFAVMPWNFPFWQVFRFAAPALMAGNTCVLKHASNVTGCALYIEKIFSLADCPKNIFRTLVIPSEQVKNVIKHPHIAAISLTGSTEAGKSVAEQAGKHLKKCVLELGGSDPYIILEDADIELAAEKCAASRLLNCGQSCIGAKRFIVHQSIQQKFEDAFVKKLSEAVLGDPTNENSTLGPMAKESLRDELHQQVVSTLNGGAKCILGGEIPEDKGAFYPATVLTNVKRGMTAYSEELFGPVATIITAKNDEEALTIANDTAFGLGSAIFTRDTEKAKRLVKHIEAGTCSINDFVKSDPRLPFGGIKESGYGRELSHHGIKEFVNIKTVVIAS